MAAACRALWPWIFLLLPAAWVAVAARVAPCDVNEYQPEDRNVCCRLCPAGHYVFKPCTVNHTTGECRPCEPGTFLAFPNRESSCQPCTQCRDDQEVVAKCTATSDQRCQCKQGSFFCNSVDCVENCFRCQRCPGAILSPCNATSNTVCAPGTDPERPDTKSESGFRHPSVSVVIVLVFFIIVAIVAFYCRKKGVRFCQPLVSFLKGSSEEPGSLPPRSSLRVEMLPPEAPEGGWSAPGTGALPSEEEGLALIPEARPHPGPPGEPEESPELQAVVVAAGSPAATEQTLGTAAPAASGPQDGTQASPSLKTLEERYEKEYFVKDKSREGTTSIYYEFEKTILGNDWKMFMRFIGLDETDIDSCECENPGNLMEQHHKMLLTWRKKLGMEASVFKLLAALHKMQLHMYLENIVNNLVAEGILGRRAETSD